MSVAAVTEQSERFVTFKIAGQLLGVPVVKVQEVIPARSVTAIPLASHEIAGFLNLRGQIVTAIDLRRRLGVSPRAAGHPCIHIIVRDEEDLISLVADSIGDVIDVDRRKVTPPPATLEGQWREFCRGVHQLEKGLLVLLDVTQVIAVQSDEARLGTTVGADDAPTPTAANPVRRS